MKHFSHDHPLLLSEEKHNQDFRCCVCSEAIFGLSYCCVECPFVLHKWCAELPREVLSHKHHLPDHPLVLGPQKLNSDSSSSQTYYCKACSSQIKTSAFAYTCGTTECSFSLHVECASFPEPLSFELHHSGELTNLRLRLSDDSNLRHKCAPRECLICGFGSNGFMFHSPTSKSFFSFLHIQCAMLPHKVKHRVHLHDLTLRPPLDESWYFEYFCDACEMERDPKNHIYYCEACEFFAHIGCGVTGSERPVQDIIGITPVYRLSQTAEEDEETEEEEEEEEGDEEGTFEDSGHEHPLIIRKSKMTEKGTTCKGCGAYIFGISYSCEHCRFILHKHCSKLPQRIQHPKHPGHHGPLLLSAKILGYGSNTDDAHVSLCVFCGLCMERGSFSYGCEKCDFRIHSLCGLIPNDLNHPSHEHTLSVVIYPPVRVVKHLRSSDGFKFPARWNRRPTCKACGYLCQDVTLECEDCNFHIHVQCFLLPPTGKHITHRHDLRLTYSYKEDPRALEYICDTCEKPRTPNRWIYSCPDPNCDIVSHVNCAVPYKLATWKEYQ